MRQERGGGVEPRRSNRVSLIGLVWESRLNWLLLFVPVAIALWALHFGDVWVFITSAVAIIPLAGMVGEATELLSDRLGPGLGGLLNATFGNATELIVSFFALSAGLIEVVKASITGSILSNILLVLGLSMIAGGWNREKQTFSHTRAGASASMLFLAVVGLVMPAVFNLAVFGTLRQSSVPVEELSAVVSIVLLVTYMASLLFSLRTRHILFHSTSAEQEEPRASLVTSVALLAIATGLTALMAELLVGAISPATKTLGMSKFFVGIVIIAIIGNAAEHYSAVTMAMKDKMDLAVTITTASSTQIALFVAPVLVLASLGLGHPMSLVFNLFEVVSVALAVLALSIVCLDGESNWFEGLQLLAVWVVMAIVFYFVPVR